MSDDDTQTATLDDTREHEHLDRHPSYPNVIWDAFAPNGAVETVTRQGSSVVVETRGTWRYLTVHEALARIVEELPAIGKNQVNTEQHFNFRGIDDVLNALNPLLGKYGVHYLPDVLERVAAHRTTSTNKTMYEVNLHVRYTFYGPAGDEVSASGWGEGTDMGDKSTNKAMTGAMKAVLVQALAIATEEQSQNDPDRHTPEETGPPVQATERQVIAVLERIRKVHTERGDYPEEWRARRAASGKPGTYAIESLEQMATGDRAMPPEAAIGVMNEVLDDVETKVAEAARAQEPCQLCGSTRAQRVMVKGVLRCSNPKDCEARVAKRAEAAANGDPAPTEEGAEGATEAGEGRPVICTGCGEPIKTDAGQVPVWDNQEQPWHSECSPMLTGGAA